MIDTLFIGLSLGCVYALIALGFALVFQTTGVLNLAQGSFVMSSGIVAAWLVSEKSFPLWSGVLIGVAIAAVGGLLLAALIVLPLARSSAGEFKTVLATLVFALVVENVALNLFGSRPIPLRGFSDASYEVLGGRVTGQYLWLFGITVLLVVGATLALKRTTLGLAMRAVAERPRVSRTLGISPPRIVMLSFGATAAIAGIAGVLIAPVQYAAFGLAIPYSVKGFVAAVVGGLGSIQGAVLGGVVVGLSEAFVSRYVSSAYQDVIVLSLLFIVLIVRPQGLLVPKFSAKTIGASA